MKNFKINMNREPLSDAELTSGGDFNQVLKTYKAMKTPFFKTAKFWFGGSAVVVASIAAVLVYHKLMDSTPGMAETKTSFIQPPVAEANIKMDGFTVDAATDTTITYKTGSTIHIPANAFTDASGNVVHGQVQLNYREFHDPADAFIAGIPMTYDSAGQKYHFETAGMMEITAMQNGQPLKTNPGALITVSMVSGSTEDIYNTYYLDTMQRQWKYLAQTNYNAPAKSTGGVTEKATPVTTEAKDSMVKAAMKNPELVQAQTEIAQLEKQKPVAPLKVDKQKPHFTIKVEESEFPELATYKNLKFEPVDEKQYDPKKASVLWENVTMKRIAGTEHYEITFSTTSEQYTLVAEPVVEDKDYEKNKAMFDAKYKEYETRLAKRKSDEARIKAEMEAKTKEVEAQIQKEIEEQKERIREYEARLQQSNLVMRTFQVANFGFWNCDCPRSMPQGGLLQAKFEDKKSSKALSVQTVYLVEKGRKALFTYYGNETTEVHFDPHADNMLWIVTNDQKVGFINAEEFKAQVSKSGEIVLKTDVPEKRFTSSDELKTYLNI